MATRLYSVVIGGGNVPSAVVEAVGSPTITTPVELTTDLGLVADGGVMALSKQDILIGLQRLKQHITKGTWPPV